MAFVITNKLIYLALPRTGSMATERGLEVVYSADRKRVRGFKTKPHHPTLAELKEMHPDRVTGNELVITTIRNPLDLIVSWWCLNPALQARMAFIEFIKTNKHSHIERDGRLFWLTNDANKLIRFESMVEDINAVLVSLSLETITIPKFNITKDKKPFMEYHTQETVQAMWDRWPKDMEIYHEQ